VGTAHSLPSADSAQETLGLGSHPDVDVDVDVSIKMKKRKSKYEMSWREKL